MADDHPEHLTLYEAAQMLGMSPATLERWARAGRIASHVSASGLRIFRRDDVLAIAVGHHPDEPE